VERARVLEENLGCGEDDATVIQRVLGLSRTLAQILGIIKRRQGAVSEEVIHHILYGGLPECDQPGLKGIEVRMVKIRASFSPHGIVIRTVVCGGYVMDELSRAKLASLIDAHRAAHSETAAA
jgi:hypothetical protein